METTNGDVLSGGGDVQGSDFPAVPRHSKGRGRGLSLIYRRA